MRIVHAHSNDLMLRWLRNSQRKFYGTLIAEWMPRFSRRLNRWSIDSLITPSDLSTYHRHEFDDAASIATAMHLRVPWDCIAYRLVSYLENTQSFTPFVWIRSHRAFVANLLFCTSKLKIPHVPQDLAF